MRLLAKFQRLVARFLSGCAMPSMHESTPKYLFGWGRYLEAVVTTSKPIEQRGLFSHGGVQVLDSLAQLSPRAPLVGIARRCGLTFRRLGSGRVCPRLPLPDFLGLGASLIRCPSSGGHYSPLIVRFAQLRFSPRTWGRHFARCHY